MEALNFILNYVGVVFGKVSLNYDFFHWCHGSFEFFHIPTLAFGCVSMAGEFEHLSTQVFDEIFLGFCDVDKLCPVRTHPLFIFYISSPTLIKGHSISNQQMVSTDPLRFF